MNKEEPGQSLRTVYLLDIEQQTVWDCEPWKRPDHAFCKEQIPDHQQKEGNPKWTPRSHSPHWRRHRAGRWSRQCYTAVCRPLHSASCELSTKEQPSRQVGRFLQHPASIQGRTRELDSPQKSHGATNRWHAYQSRHILGTQGTHGATPEGPSFKNDAKHLKK